jgi:hypothetical protein
MISHVEREIFTPEEVAVWCDAVDLVRRVSVQWGNELRCHELVRAAHKCLGQLGRRTEIVDGKLFAIEHSWLSIVGPAAPPGLVRDLRLYSLLDVYCPGRLPQVQIIHNHFIVARGYEEGPARTDINESIVARVVLEMERPRP